MNTTTTAMSAILVVLLAMPALPAAAVDTEPPPTISAEHAAGRKAIEARNWDGAIKALTAAAQRDSSNADIQNLLGYAHRNAGRLEAALKHYQRALQLDPRHLGAHEYIGEAYLMAGNLAKAEEHLAALKRYCMLACEERDDLARKIEAHRARGK